ncbi:PDZ domain-containing protein [Deinococcus sonorensis]|uniref:PDZ domain-containing protein n=1 Tax=Deinococcus sonorensis TaxID=309891 RepID=A0ABV8Y881_9DEIO
MKTRVLITALTLAQAAPAVMAQATPPASQAAAFSVLPLEAAALLDKALAYNGGPALAALKYVRYRYQVADLGPDGQPMNFRNQQMTTDYAGARLRTETVTGRDVTNINQITPAGGSYWDAAAAPPVGPLPANVMTVYRRSLYSGLEGLRSGARNRDSARVLGPRTVGGVSGTGLEVVTYGVTTAYLLSPEGALLGEFADDGAWFTLYSDFRQRDGVRFPFAQRDYDSTGRLVTVTYTLAATPLASIPVNTFRAPAPVVPLDAPIGLGMAPARVEPSFTGFRVLSVSADSPAGRAGFQVGDELVGIEGVDVEPLNTAEVVLRLRGPAGAVAVDVRRAGQAAPVRLTLVRAAVPSH